MNFKLFNTIILIQIFFSLYSIYAISNIDYLILKEPANFRIYNKYEQQLTSSGRSLLTENCPLQIIHEDTLLSDAFTPCMVVSLENQFFYIIKDSLHQPVNKLKPSEAILIKNATVSTDTIQVLKTGKLILSSPWEKDNKLFLPNGATVKRIFHKNFRTYVKTLEPPLQYGWIDLNKSNDWKVKSRATKKELSSNNDVESIIEKQIEDVNTILAKLFSHFNKIRHAYLKAPFWHLEKHENTFICRLMNKPENADFKKSTNLLMGKLQSDLIKLKYHVDQQAEEIVIFPQQNF